MQQDLQVYTDNAGRFFISRDDHRRYCDSLLGMARVWGDDAEDVLRQALQNSKPSPNSALISLQYFGPDMPIVQEILNPLREMIGKMLPGFDVWMTVTNFGDDKEFILALVNWQRVIVKAPKPSGKDRREIFAGIAAQARIAHKDPTVMPFIQPEHTVLQ
jgi:hypothetical protein